MSEERVDAVGEMEYDGKANWKIAQGVGTKFFEWMLRNEEQLAEFDLASIEREKVHEFFVVFGRKALSSFREQSRSKQTRLESLVMAALKKQKLVKMKRYDDGVVICSFARADGSFAPYQDRVTARDKLKIQRKALQADKGGIVVSANPIVSPADDVLPVNTDIDIQFPISHMEADSSVELFAVTIGGHKKNSFQVVTDLPVVMDSSGGLMSLSLSLRTTATAIYRADVLLQFRAMDQRNGEELSILRSLSLSAAKDPAMLRMLQPVTPYKKKKKRRDHKSRFNRRDIVHPPKQESGSGAGTYKRLSQYKIPIDVRETVSSKGEDEVILEPPTPETPQIELARVYRDFWQQLLWMSELQTYEDIKLFDIEKALLKKHGRLLKLSVPGLAEGRPSVLRGDIVHCNWGGKQYHGRVESVQLLDVLLQFSKSFHQKFDVNLDCVDLVRFTFSRTTFRTSHQGCLLAPAVLREAMLMPKPVHVERILKNSHQRTARVVPGTFSWASRSLNEEQKTAVEKIAKATLRPLPYIIFGPPGTGYVVVASLQQHYCDAFTIKSSHMLNFFALLCSKTTTMTEAVYQLARLHTYNRSQQKLRILLVAPSNDATDILVEKLSVHFPPSEMLRVLAYTRNILDVPPAVRPYCKEELDQNNLENEMAPFQIVAATVNLAARFSNTGKGIPKGFFDVICIDEAGHATEPEVMGVVAPLMKSQGESPGQLVLAGDPNQLGPVITSVVCQRFFMGRSYMERLLITSPAYKEEDSERDHETTYPPDLVTMLIRNYRSHPEILKLPNDLFYDGKLQACGERLATHSMAKWEHLPPTCFDFPIIFHSVDGKNDREGSSPSWFNAEEVLEVVDYVDLLVNQSRPRVALKDIGVITPYSRQVQKIKLALAAKNFVGVKVGSVETFQGQERRCIILSTVRSEQALLSHDQKYNLGFVANEKRFNVAITRAKALLIVIGNPIVLAADRRNWLPFLRLCKASGGWIGEEWTDDLAMPEARIEMSDNPAADDDEDEWEIVPDDVPQGYINREE